MANGMNKKLTGTLEAFSGAMRAIPAGVMCAVVLYDVEGKQYATASNTDSSELLRLLELAVAELKEADHG